MKEHLKILESMIKMTKYLISSVHKMTTPFVVLIEQQQGLFLGPVLREHDFLGLMIIALPILDRIFSMTFPMSKLRL